MAKSYVCLGCTGRTNSRQRLCANCCRELACGLYGGQWVVVKGVRRWQPDRPAVGRPPTPLLMTEADRKRGYAEYRRGIRTPFTEAACREYQRLHKRMSRAAA